MDMPLVDIVIFYDEHYCKLPENSVKSRYISRVEVPDGVVVWSNAVPGRRNGAALTVW